MTKDPKNRDYRDQIYYTLAEIEFKEDNREKGIEYLTSSAQTSTTNKKQKEVISKIDLTYNDKDFVQSKYYYDSCLNNIEEDYPNYKAIEYKARV